MIGVSLIPMFAPLIKQQINEQELTKQTLQGIREKEKIINFTIETDIEKLYEKTMNEEIY